MTQRREEYDLVKELEKRAKNNNKADAYFHRFKAMLDYLEKNYYTYVQANCPYFTDHGKLHIEGVIWAASQLLGKNIKQTSILSELDLYLLLTSIIWHDAGMVAKRKGHEVAVQNLLNKVSELAFEDIEEKRLVEEIIAAHTGTGGFLRMNPQTPYSHYIVYPRALAAILRLADEISEDSSRISIGMLDGGLVPADHQIFWYYAKSIKASHPEPLRERILIEGKLNYKEAIMEFGNPDRAGSITLVEYVLNRLEKIVAESAYCAPHFVRYASIQWVEITLSLVNGTQQVNGYCERLRYNPVSDQYPASFRVCESFFHDHPNWDVGLLRSLK